MAEVLQHDVLVVGAGLAGMRAAIAARAGGANTAIISKVHPVSQPLQRGAGRHQRGPAGPR